MNAAVNYRSKAGFEAAMRLYERALDHWPVAAQQRMVSTRVGETFVISFGDPANPPLMLLHGSAANSSSWALDAAGFASVFRVHAIDLPGETGKSTGHRPPYAGSTYPGWLADVLDELDVASASFAGLSLGGWVCLKFASQSPERVRRVVLLAPGGVVPARAAFSDRAGDALALGEVGIRQLAAAIFSPQAPPPGVEEAFVFIHSIYDARRDELPLITDAELARVSAPTLLLGGAHDAMLDMPATDARLRRCLLHYESEIDPEGGHALVNKGEQVLVFLTADRPARAPGGTQ